MSNRHLVRLAVRSVMSKGELVNVINTETGKATQVTKETLKSDPSKYKEVKEEDSSKDKETESKSTENVETPKPSKEDLKKQYPNVPDNIMQEAIDNYNTEDLKEFLEEEEKLVQKQKEQVKQQKRQQREQSKPKLNDVSQQLKQKREQDQKEKDRQERGQKPPSQDAVREQIKQSGLETFNNFKDADLDSIQSQVSSMESYLSNLGKDPDASDEEKAEAMANLGALRVLETVKAGEEATGIGTAASMMVNQAVNSGNEDLIGKFIMSDLYGGQAQEASVATQAAYRDTLDTIPTNDLMHILPEDHPGRELAKMLSDVSKNGPARFLNEKDKAEIGEWLKDMLQAEASFMDPALSGPDKTVGEAKVEASKVYGEIQDADLGGSKDRSQFKIRTKSLVQNFIDKATSFVRDIQGDPILTSEDYVRELERKQKELEAERAKALAELEKKNEEMSTQNKKSSISKNKSIPSLYRRPISSDHFNLMSIDRTMTRKVAENFVNYQERANQFTVGDTVTVYGYRKDFAGRVTGVYPGIGMVDVEFPQGNKRYPVEQLQLFSSNGNVEPPLTQSGRVAMTKRVALYWADKNRQYRMNKNEISSGKAYCPRCGQDHLLSPTNYKMRDGVRERLLGCGNCLFLVKDLDILNSPFKETDWE